MVSRPDDWSHEEILGSVPLLSQKEIRDEVLFRGADPDFAYRHGGDGLRSVLELHAVQERIRSGDWQITSFFGGSEGHPLPFTSKGHRDSQEDPRQKILCSFGLAGTDYYRGKDRNGQELWTSMPNGLVVAHRMNADRHKRGDVRVHGIRNLITIVESNSYTIPHNKVFCSTYFGPL